jgi:hypothetical protein
MPYYHPGSQLLPASDLVKFDSLPPSVFDQISGDGQYYDIYGKMGLAFDDGLIDAPVGKAGRDYTSWLEANPDIAEEIDGLIKQNAVAQYGDLEWKDFDGVLTPFKVDDLYYESDPVPPLSDPSVLTDEGTGEIEEEIIDLDQQEESKPKKPTTPPDTPDADAEEEGEWWQFKGKAW